MFKRDKYLLCLGLAGFFSSLAFSEGLIRSIWGCSVPCESKLTHEPVGYIQVSYCSTWVFSPKMFESLHPVCQSKTKRKEAIAVRTSVVETASCISSSTPCSKEGLVRSGYSCSFLCPSEDKAIRKFTACASTDEEAWSYVTQICKDAVPPHASYFATSRNCVVEGQASCE